jgi:hypothetical protein
MASVFIDIPGIGNVEAKNAATESTLRELVSIMKGIKKNTGGGGAGGGGGTTTDAPGGPTSALGKAANMTGKALGTMAKTAGVVVGGFDTLSKVTTGIIQSFANVGDSVESAAGIFKGIPIVGTVFGAVASAAQKVTDSYLPVAKSGATFGGSINSFAASASAAGMTMDKFGAMVSRNGAGMLGLASNTEEGAKRFAQISKTLRTTSGDLYALGYSTEDINQGLATYSANLRAQGLQGKKSNAELAAGAKNYLKEIDMLAKITGEERSAKEAQMKALLADAQFNAAMAGKDENVRKDFANFVGSFGPKMGGFVKDFIATGTTTTEANAKIAAMLGTDVMNQLTGIRQKMLRNERLTDAEQDLVKKAAKKASEAQMIQSGGALAASREMDDATGAMVESMGYTENAHQDARKSQDSATAGTDKMNEQMQKAQQMLAGFSNSFLMALANSGTLDTLMQTFGIVAGIVQTVVVPAFDVIGKLINEVVFPVFRDLAAFFVAYVIPGVKEAINNLLPIFQAVGEVLLPPLQAVGKFIFENLTPLLVGLGSVFLAYKTIVIGQNILEAIRTGTLAASIAGFLGLNVAMLPFVAIAAAVVVGLTAMWYIFKKLGGDTEVLSDGFKWLWSYLEEFGQNLVLLYYKIMDKITVGSEYKDKAKEQEDKIKATQEERLATEKRMSDRMAANRAAMEAKDKKYEDTKNALDLKKLNTQKKGTESLESANKKQAEEQQKKLDLNASETDLLKQYAEQQGSAYIKDKPTGMTVAEANKAGMVQEAQSAKEGAIKKAEEAQKKEEEAKKANTTTAGTGTATQESPATLLASLNNKMDQLINVNRRVFEVAENQLSVQKGLTGNLYKSI